MALAASNLPEIVPGGATVRVTVMPMFDPGEARIRFEVPHGATVADILAIGLPHMPAPERVRVALTTNKGFCIVDRAVWSLVRPHAGVHVIVRVTPGGPALLPVLNLLVTVAAKAIAASPLLGLSPFAQNLLVFAITTAGGLLLNMLFRPDAPDQDKPKPNYAISGWRNEGRPDSPVPLVLGKVRYAPRYAASTYVEVVGDRLYLRSVFNEGYGPIVKTLPKIGETDIDEFEEVEVESLPGEDDDPDLTLYTTQVIEESLGVDLVKEPELDDEGEPEGPDIEKPVTRFTANDASEACIILNFPIGLAGFDEDVEPRGMDVKVEHRLVGAPDWIEVETVQFYERKESGFFRSFRWTLVDEDGIPVRGRYEVRLTRLTNSSDRAQVRDKLTWFALQSFRPESPFNFSKPNAKTAIRVKATGQLNGTLDTFNEVVSGEVRDLVGGDWLTIQETQNPAALALHVLTGNHQAYPADDSEIDFPAFEGWSVHNQANGLKFNRVIDYEASLGELLQMVGAAGRAVVWWDGEKWTVTIDQPQTYIVAHISPRNASNFRWSTNYFEPPDAIRVTFLDETNDYLEAERIIPWPADVRFATKAERDADLNWREGIRAEVYADPTPANNGYSRKVGPSGSGNWADKPFDITESLDLPGKTNPDEIWIETRRLQYERIYRNTMYTATQPGSARVVAPGDAVMLSRDVLVRAMHSARVLAVVGNRIEVDGVFVMDEGGTYGIRFRAYENDEDTAGESVLRTIKTIVGENRAVTLIAGDEETPEQRKPSVGDLVHFGPVASDSIPVIVAGIERGEDNSSILHMLPAADEMHEKVAAEVPPTWSGRVGADLGGSNTAPPVPLVLEVLSGLTGTGDADGLKVRLRPADGSSVVVAKFEIQHRISGAPTWEAPASAPAGAGVVAIPGYSNGDAVEWQPRSVSINNIPSATWGTTRTTTIGEDDPAVPGALNESLIVIQPGMGKADIFATMADSLVNTTHVQLYHNTTGTLNTATDKFLGLIAVEPGASFSRVAGDPSIVSILANGDLASAGPPPTVGANWSIGSGVASKTSGGGNSLSWTSLTLSVTTYRYAFDIDAISGTSPTLTPRLTGGTTVTGTAYTTSGRKRGTLTALSGNNSFAVIGNTASIVTVDDFVFYLPTADCLDQGNNYFWFQPFNGVTPGPVSSMFTVAVD